MGKDKESEEEKKLREEAEKAVIDRNDIDWEKED